MLSRNLDTRRCLVNDESGATTPEYGILLVIGLTTALSIGMLLRDAVIERFEASSLTSQHAPHHHSPQSITRNSAPNFRRGGISPQQARSFLIFVQGTLAAALIIMIVRRTRSESKVSKPLRTRESLDEQLKNILLALRHQSLRDTPLEPLISHIMSTNVATVPVNARTEEASSLLNSMHEVVFVLNQEDAIVGQVSDVVIGGGTTVRQAMRDVPLRLTKTTRVSTALRSMLDHGCSVAPVLDGEELCGVVSTVDIKLTLMAMIQLFKETQLRHREMMLDACGSTTSWEDLSSR